MTDHHYDTIAIIGLGLVGSSIALACKSNDLTKNIACYDSAAEVRATGAKLKLGTMTESLAEAVKDADLVILAVPVGVMGEVAAEAIPNMKDGAVLTDTGSTKTSVIGDISPHLKESVFFIPSHPIAGTEYSGPEAGFATLFKDRYWIVLPMDAPEDEVEKLRAFYRAMGAMVEDMEMAYHDRVLALTSHLPHLIAYTIVGTAFDFEKQVQNDVFKFSASGFRDFTRIASSDPVMWRDVFMNNSDAVLEMLGRFNEDLSYLQRAIRWHEADKLEELFSRTRAIRSKIKDYGQLD